MKNIFLIFFISFFFTLNGKAQSFFMLTKGTTSVTKDTARWAFSLTAHTVPAGFVNIFGNAFTSVITGDNQANTMHFSTVSTSNWRDNGGNCGYDIYGMTGSTAAGFPDSILYRAFFMYSGSAHFSDSATLGLATNQYQITGLSNANTYTITLVGAINRSIANFTSANKYYISNGTTVYVGSPAPFDAGNNTSGIVTFTGVVPDGTGKLKGYLFTVSGQEACEMNGMIVATN